MAKPRDHYPKALVPEHLTKMTIEKLPFDQVYYVEPGEAEEGASPAIFKSPDGRLVMSTSYAIDAEDEYPASPVGMVGVMKTYHISPETRGPVDCYIADLRFMNDLSLVDCDELSKCNDQEEIMAWLRELENTITFSGFIAAEPGADVDDSGRIKGSFFGDESLVDVLNRMRKHGDKQMKNFMRRESVPSKIAAVAKNSTISDEATPSEEQVDKPKKMDRTDLSVHFSHRNS